MWKRLILCLLAIALALPLTALGEGTQRVFMEGETEPFPEDAELLTVRVCPLLGADAMLLTLGEHTMLIDAGKKSQYDDVFGMLQDAGLTAVEYALNTHPHSDHAGCIKPLLEQGFGIGTFITFFPYDYGDSGQAVIQKSTIQALEAAGVPIVTMKTEDTIPFGSALLTVYRMPDERFVEMSDCNNRSAMLMIRYGECSILLAADVENEVQPKLAEMYDLKADILKYPHHGTVILHNDFLKDVDPEYVVFTHGTKNTLDAQKQLIRFGYDRMTFATWGLITMQTDGQKWIVRQDISPDLTEYASKYKPGGE